MTLAEDKPSFYLDLSTGVWVVVAPEASEKAHCALIAELLKRLQRDDHLGKVQKAQVDGSRGVLLRLKDNVSDFENILQEALARVCRCSPDDILERYPASSLPQPRQPLATV